jgi:hypothetical protein
MFPFWGKKSPSSKKSAEETTPGPERSSIWILLELLVLGPKNEVTTNKL